jgi:hypothetical protein
MSFNLYRFSEVPFWEGGKSANNRTWAVVAELVSRHIRLPVSPCASGICSFAGSVKPNISITLIDVFYRLFGEMPGLRAQPRTTVPDEFSTPIRLRQKSFSAILKQEVHIYGHMLESSADEITIIVLIVLITNPYHCSMATLP